MLKSVPSRELDPEKEAIFRTIQAGILIVDAREHVIQDANAAALKLIGRAKEAVIGQCCHSFVCPAERGKCPITDLHTTVDCSERILLGASGKRVPILKSVATVSLNGRDCLLECFLDLTERKRTEEELKRAQADLITSSRLAGMAEVATSVLHNVGNVLNSVNVSVNVLSSRIQRSKGPNLARAVALIRQHPDNLGSFLSQDPKGREIPAYLESLAQHLIREQGALLEELKSLRQSVEHIEHTIMMQQSYAQMAGVKENVKVADLVLDALRLNADGLARHQVQVIREFDPTSLPEITAEKHKVLQILVNLIRNAQYACNESGRSDKHLVVRVAQDPGQVEISIADNGIGIPPENLTRIFNYGFTTRRNGHGFGLHSGALAAQELGGSLRAQSEGIGRGAVFTLQLPTTSPKET